MQTTITARHFTASPALRQYASARLNRLEKYYDGITDARVVLHQNALTKRAEITLRVYRQRLSAQDGAQTYEEAIDQCVERLRKQLIRYKDKLRSTKKDVHH